MKKLYRSTTDKMLTGLCGGLARHFNLDTTLVRLLVAAAAFFSFGTVLLIYIIASIIIPKETFGNSFTDSFDHY
ncbi:MULTISPECIES: PspC domain-containing protein [unclassified Paenibacillus]|uniref:PspC domain-containing protein n=1 Tax=unclassified Paenibacillus TaxID=185978 RepID=UPI002404B496|nr:MULTISPECIES: PspC domain-containing protein [unclassified Paenibacillus]MDF9843478.1 phage shock protein C [Paenibacillus sp. PastF-2]MDF9850066.1 phage shock protein C [Paenibacillus sp. PastM-2]MDF9857730.1 phage shock protein C [Paenibacillus sp. PastF-1]MDH6482997.1 phage shock protein C [Paenibacillus sp. PastH-2]MDH6509200.1 phage shock protein C [Paenibacillus sp. PastM-3]